MTSTKKRILIVDDEPSIADTLAAIFREAGYCAEATYSGEGALACATISHPSLLISDLMMPKMDGITLAREIRRSYPECHILLFTGSTDMLNEARREGWFEVLAKPMTPHQILMRVAILLEEEKQSWNSGDSKTGETQ